MKLNNLLIIAVAGATLTLVGCHQKQAPMPVSQDTYVTTVQKAEPVKKAKHHKKSKKLSAKQRMHLYTK